MKNLNVKLKIIDAIEKYVSIALLLLILTVAMRLFEGVLLSYYHYNPLATNLLRTLVDGVLLDVLYFSKLSLLLLPIFCFIFYFSEKAASIFIKVVFTLLLIISASLVLYFVTEDTPLDSVLFCYSLDVIVKTVGTTEPIVWWSYVLVFSVPLTFLLINKWKPRIRKGLWISFLVLSLLSAFFNGLPEKFYVSNKEYCTAMNKLAYLIESAQQKKQRQVISYDDLKEKAMQFQSYFPDYEFIDKSYPFLHAEQTPDVLSDFFSPFETKPNIVIIIVEGLGKNFSFGGGTYSSTTPFLDSLAQTGLLWTHCFSTSQRTVCALPSIFGALPYGNNGFMSYRYDLPRFISLPKILSDNGYENYFFYGGWLGFDDMDSFIAQNDFSYIFDAEKITDESRRNSWGIFDDALFAEAINEIDFESRKPRFDVYLTLTTHDPFEYPNRQAFTQQYFVKEQADNHFVKGNERELGSYLYLDSSMRVLIEAYKSKPNFANTIFVITGDHNFDMSISETEVYHVPLLIWSARVMKPTVFPMLASHRQITPSLLAFLDNNFTITRPDKVAWLNKGLDTSMLKQQEFFLPQFNLGRNINQLYYNGYYQSERGLQSVSVEDGELVFLASSDNSLNPLLDLYRELNIYVMEHDVLIKK